MEDVLEVYSRPYDENLPVVCMDEKPVQLLAEAREGFTSNSTGIRYEDNEYVRNGTCSIFLFTEPLAGWRHAEAKQQRTRTDWQSASSGCLTKGIRTLSVLFLCVTTLILIISRPFMKRSSLRKHSGWRSVLKCTIHRNMVVG